MSDDFLSRGLVGEENQLAIGYGGGKANNRASFEDQNGLGFFSEEFALGAGIAGAGASGNDGGFESDWFLGVGVVGAQCAYGEETRL